MEHHEFQEAVCIVEETIESLEGAACGLESVLQSGELSYSVRTRLFALRDVLCVCAGRMDAVSAILDTTEEPE